MGIPVIRYPLITLILLAAAAVSCKPELKVEEQINEFHQMRKYFEDPPASHRTVPFWVWNGEVTREMIDEQLENFHERGFGGVFVHPRYGLITEYLSGEWFELVEYAMKRAEKLGMYLWIYDENSFPSGFAGGHVAHEMPSSYNEGQMLKLHRQSVLQPDTSREYLHIFKDNQGISEITQNREEWEGERGSFLLFELLGYEASDWFAGYPYVDLIKPGVTEKFIEVTMTGYEETIGQEFGGIVPGVFTDEPNIATRGHKDAIRWTPDLYERFEERWGYALQPHLVSLLENRGDFRRVRHNYYQVLLELFIERWAEPWYNYTEEKGLSWTGHYWEHGWPSPHHGPDNMAMYAWHQVPGIDMLFNNYEVRPDQFGNIRAVRELNSVANQLGRTRRLSETYGASGWELTFEDMKRNGDWEYVLGVNLMNQHLSYQTLMGDRKHDFPQSFSYQVPWWEEYNSLADYYGRLSLALSSGEQHQRIIVIEPTTTAWMHYAIDDDQTAMDALKDNFDRLLGELEQQQIEYDLGCENIMKDHGRIENGKMVVGEQQYSYVVLPEGLENLNTETAGLLESFLNDGGRVVALCQPPGYIDGKPAERLREWPSEYGDQWLSLSGCNDPRLLTYLQSDELVIVEQEGGTLYHQRRILDDGQLMFLVNNHPDESAHVRINMQGRDIAELDLFTGAIYTYPCVVTSGIASFDVDLPPAGSKLLFIAEEEIRGKDRGPESWRGQEYTILLEEKEVTPTEENVLNLDYCFLTIGRTKYDQMYFYEAQTEIFRQHGFSKNPWVSSSQFKQEILERDTFPPGSGFTAEFPFYLDTDMKETPIELVVEKPWLYEVSINGENTEQIPDTWWLDKNFGVFDLAGKLRDGENMIRLSIHPMSVHAELEPVYLKGPFDVVPLDEGWLITRKMENSFGSWKEQGYPFYSSSFRYAAKVTPGRHEMARVILPDWNGVLAVVYVNGERAGQIISPPYQLRIEDYLRRGENRVVVEVYGSLKNLLGPHHNVRRRGIVTPWSFKYAPETQPSGVEYDLVDYGLFEPFRVEVTRR